MKTVLFVCTGNTCRSPMAEGIARHLASAGRMTGVSRDTFFASAGVFTSDGRPVSPETRRALAKHGIEWEGRSKVLSPEMVRRADLVLAMTEQHAEAVREILPAGSPDARKVHVLDPSGDVPDPIGLGQESYDLLAERLLRLLPTRVSECLAR